jgi:hypothetical protein
VYLLAITLFFSAIQTGGLTNLRLLEKQVTSIHKYRLPEASQEVHLRRKEKTLNMKLEALSKVLLERLAFQKVKPLSNLHLDRYQSVTL